MAPNSGHLGLNRGQSEGLGSLYVDVVSIFVSYCPLPQLKAPCEGVHGCLFRVAAPFRGLRSLTLDPKQPQHTQAP